MSRRERKFWAAHEDTVTKVNALECAGYDGVWWVPSLGYTLHEGVQLFDSEAEAISAVEGTLLAAIASAEKKLATLSATRGETP